MSTGSLSRFSLCLWHLESCLAQSMRPGNTCLHGFLHQVRVQHAGKLRLPNADPTLGAEPDAQDSSTAPSCLLSTPGVTGSFPWSTPAFAPAPRCHPASGPDTHQHRSPPPRPARGGGDFVTRLRAELLFKTQLHRLLTVSLTLSFLECKRGVLEGC